MIIPSHPLHTECFIPLNYNERKGSSCRLQNSISIRQ
uniref:Uncharacterized protein n=1 Tax=Myoviridae sp. ctxym25 TaxID=2825210 RepID=A0A8S5QHM2_9CAUD|nr:MAG TPA: hypothetical protein [Myoviridae sp. ctxym25]